MPPAIVLGELACRVVDELPASSQPALVVVFCHGFGAPASDLVPLGPELLSLQPELAERVRFVFPAAPLTLDDYGLFGGRAWWPIDMERFAATVASGRLRDLRDEVPAELVRSRQLVLELVAAIESQWQVPPSRIVLGGFSQGAVLATDVALRLPTAPAGLCVFSGTLMCESQWRPLAARRGPLRVLQSHGSLDPVLPYVGAQWLREFLQHAGFDVQFLDFVGGHTIPFEALEHCGTMLRELSRAD